eukprot:6478325-Amphidinium_carterae.1
MTGCPLSSPYRCCSDDVLPEISPTESGAWSYMDDIMMITAAPDTIAEALLRTEQHLTSLSFMLRSSKSSIVTFQKRPSA